MKKDQPSLLHAVIEAVQPPCTTMGSDIKEQLLSYGHHKAKNKQGCVCVGASDMAAALNNGSLIASLKHPLQRDGYQ